MIHRLSSSNPIDPTICTGGTVPDAIRIGIAIEAPDATAFFDSARVLLIGETNTLTAQFSSEAIAQRSRLRIEPAFAVEQEAGKEELRHGRDPWDDRGGKRLRSCAVIFRIFSVPFLTWRFMSSSFTRRFSSARSAYVDMDQR